MMFNPYLAQRVGVVRMEDALREAKQTRLIRAAKGPRKVRGWWLPVTLVLSSLFALFMRPQS